METLFERFEYFIDYQQLMKIDETVCVRLKPYGKVI